MLVGRIPQDFNQRMLRAFACRVDQLGIDPLQDAIVPRLLEINSFSLHTRSPCIVITPSFSGRKYRVIFLPDEK